VLPIQRVVNEAKVYAASVLPTPIERRCVVVARARTGSTLLMSLLDSHPRMVGDGELLTRRRASPGRYVLGAERVAARRKPGARAYAFKVLGYQLVRIQHSRHVSTLVPYLHGRGWDVVHLVRSNVLKQVLSNMAAKQTKYHYRQKSLHEPLAIDTKELQTRLAVASRAAEVERRILGNVPHMLLTYEDDLEPPESQQRTADRIFTQLGLPTHAVETPLVKALPTRIADIVANYRDVAMTLRGTEFERFLDA